MVVPDVHGKTKSLPHNRTLHSSLQHVVSFIENYSQREGLTLPGRVMGYKSFRIKLLPISTTKAELWRSPKEATGVEDRQFLNTPNLSKHGTNFLHSSKQCSHPLIFAIPDRIIQGKYWGMLKLQKRTKLQP